VIVFRRGERILAVLVKIVVSLAPKEFLSGELVLRKVSQFWTSVEALRSGRLADL